MFRFASLNITSEGAELARLPHLPTGRTGVGLGGNGSGAGTGLGGVGGAGGGLGVGAGSCSIFSKHPHVGSHGQSSTQTSDISLEPFAVDLIDENKTTDKIPIFLIRETKSARGPGKLARRFGVIGVVNEITCNSIILRDRFSFVHQDRVIDAETRISCEKSDE